MTLIPFITQPNSRKETIWAIGTIASVKPGLVRRAAQTIRSFLDNDDPALRGYAAWALGNLRDRDSVEQLKNLEKDEEVVNLFVDGELKEVSVGRLAKEALEKIGQKTS